MAAGHRHADVLDYTLTQFTGYLELALKRERREWRQQILAANWGVNGGRG
ncbi:UNVERIFIED_ORG: hypothetical protein LHJ69_14145 [Shinella sp. XGS7]|nr:hypothetical protein [Shinella sp. XGS7]